MDRLALLLVSLTIAALLAALGSLDAAAGWMVLCGLAAVLRLLKARSR